MWATKALAYGPLVAILVGMAGAAAWVFIHARVSYLLRWVLIPAALVAAFCSAQIYDLRLGYAAPAPLPTKFVYLGHHVVVLNGEKTAVEVWAQTRNTRLYRLPYSRGLETSMDKAQTLTDSGKTVVVHRNKPGVEADTKPYESNIVLPSDANPKK